MGTLVEGSRDSRAPAEAVWDVLADIDRWPETFAYHLSEAHIEGPLRVGSEGYVRTKRPPIRSGFTVTAYEEGRSFAWRGSTAGLTLDFDHRVEPTEDGCRITFDVDLSGPIAPIARPVLRASYRPQMEAALERLAAVGSV